MEFLINLQEGPPERFVIYPMPGNNAPLKIDFTDPKTRSFIGNLFYILDWI